MTDCCEVVNNEASGVFLCCRRVQNWWAPAVRARPWRPKQCRKGREDGHALAAGARKNLVAILALIVGLSFHPLHSVACKNR